jgi:hypothetical protein
LYSLPVAVRYSGAGERKGRPRTVRFEAGLDAWLAAVGKRHHDGMTGVITDALKYWREVNGDVFLDSDDINSDEGST